jgi:hypothetical protein
MDASQISSDMEIVTPSDTNLCNGVGFVFTGGDCAVVTDRGRTVVVPAAFAGIIFPQAIDQVRATGTTATSVIVFRG